MVNWCQECVYPSGAYGKIISVESDNAEINSEKIMADWVLCTNSKYYAGPYSITNETNIFEDKIVTYIFKDLTRLNLLYYVFVIVYSLNPHQKICL